MNSIGSDSMYNSVTISVLAKIWSVISRGYEYSILRVILNCLGRGLCYISRGSNIINLFTSNRRKMEESLFYNIYCKIMYGIQKILEVLNKLINKLRSGSFIDISTTSNFKDEESIQDALSIFLLFFGLTVFILNAVRGKFFGNSFKLSILIILIGIIGYKYDGGYIKIIRNSNSYKLVNSIFTIDKGGEKWW